MKSGVSRRDMLLGAFRRRPTRPVTPRRQRPVSAEASEDAVAVIMGRHCLAYLHVTCSTCFERCPVPGAIVRERGVPRVVADACTGCRVCREVCPAPVNAVLMVARRPGAPAPGGG